MYDSLDVNNFTNNIQAAAWYSSISNLPISKSPTILEYICGIIVKQKKNAVRALCHHTCLPLNK